MRLEETFGKLIEDNLNAEYGKKTYKKFEVINVSWPGINTAQEYLVLRDRGLAYKPDMVLVAYFPNDSGPFRRDTVNPTAPIYIRRPPNRPGKEPYALPLPESINMFLTLKSDLFMLTMKKYDTLLHKVGLRQKSKGDNLLGPYEEKSRAWESNKVILRDIASLCRQNQVVHVLTMIPFFHALEKYKYKTIHEKVLNVAANAGFSSLDLLPLFEGKESASIVVSRIDSHPNAAAHRLMAESILNHIIENRLIPSLTTK